MGGAALAATKIDPIKMLFWAAVINGVVAVPIMAGMMLMVSGSRGRRMFALPDWLMRLGWLGALVMAITVAALAWSALGGS
jgi:Mn2+/Fe2+ NRAMP family transporter